MVKQTYEIVEHNGGFAYRVGDVYSETFATHEAAHKAAESAAQRQQLGDEPHQIEYEDAKGRWHTEMSGGDRPETVVEDRLPEDEEARDRHGEKLDESELPNPDRAPFEDLRSRPRK